MDYYFLFIEQENSVTISSMDVISNLESVVRITAG